MALDERRSKFKICRYQSKDASEILKDTTTELGAPVPVPKKVEQEDEKETKDLVRVSTSPRIPRKPKKWQSQDHEETEFERQMRHAEPFETDVLEVWFAGCHADVGGGAVPNDERHRLSQIPLRWMIRQCFECDTGIIFKTRALANVGLDVHTLWPRYRNLGVPSIGPPPHIMERYEEGLPPRHHRSTRLIPIDGTHRGDGLYHLKIFGEDEEEAHKTGEWLPEQIEDYFDAFAPANDQLLVAKGWWILEVWPVEYKIQALNSDAWESKFGMNLGMYRCVEGPKPNIHWTVQHLIAERGYKVQARIERNAHWNIVA